MKKILSLLVAGVMLMGLAACGNSGDTSSTGSAGSGSGASQTAELSGTVNTDGSTSMESVMGALIEQFESDHSGVTVNYSGTGSGAGVTAAQQGTADIGLASRDLKEEETGVKSITVAKDGIAIIVNPNNPVANLSVEQIAQLATGEITNWSDVGGNDGEVVFIGREAGSGTRDGFESITDTEDKCKYTNELTVDNVAPSEATVLDGTYKIQRNFNFIVSDTEALSDVAQAFVDFATSTDASDLIADAGAVPLV